MVFLTVGSRSFQFDRLLEAVDSAIENGEITDDVFAQIGSSAYHVKHYQTVEFLGHDEFNQKMNACDIVLTHGGTGIIVNAVKMGKRVIAVPRMAQYHEVVDDHQIQLVEAFEKMGMVTGCYDCGKLGEAFAAAKAKPVQPYVPNTQRIIDSIDRMIASGEKANRARVLMCGSDRKEKGGMNSVIEQLMNHDWDEQVQLFYLATHVTGNAVKKLLFWGKSYLELHKLIRKDAFDILHAHMSYKGSFFRKYYAAVLCKKKNKKVIIHLHGSEFKVFYHNANERLKKKIVRLFTEADVTIALGNDWKQFITEIAPNARVEVINNAIALPEFSQKNVGEKRIFLFLGALIKRKGVIDLLTAAKRLRENGISDFKLLIAGDGEEKEALKKYVQEHGLQDFVEFLGWITETQKPDILKKSDVLVLPSYNEGLPIAILEAMSYGLPIISTRVGSIADAVHTGQNGFLFEPGDVGALEAAMRTMITSPNEWKSASCASRQICEEKFKDSVFFEKIQEIYLRLV